MKKIFLCSLFIVSFCSLVFADQITLTTYYPAPFGMYQEMRVMGKLGVGTTNPQAKLDVEGTMVVTGGSGDVNGVGGVTAQDLALIRQYLDGTSYLTRAQAAEADVDGNGVVTGEDENIIGNILLGYPRDYVKRVISRVAHKAVAFPAAYTPANYFLVDGLVGVGVTNPAYSLQVGDLGGATAPVGSNPAAAIQNDLWVNGNIYGNSFYGDGSNLTGIGGWTRDATHHVIYATSASDTVGIGVPVPAANSTAKLEIHTRSTGDYGIFQSQDSGTYSKNFFAGRIGLGTVNPRAGLDINPALVAGEIAPYTARTYNLLSVGNSGVLSTSATAKIYGTMLVSDAATFAGKVKTTKSLQVGTDGASQPACNSSNVGLTEYRCLTNGLGQHVCGMRACVQKGSNSFDWYPMATAPAWGGIGVIVIEEEAAID